MTQTIQVRATRALPSTRAAFSLALLAGLFTTPVWAQTVTLDGAVAANSPVPLCSVISGGLAQSSVAIDPDGGNATVRVNCANRAVTFTNPPPATANPSATFSIAYQINSGFTGTVTCQRTLVQGSGVTGWTATDNNLSPGQTVTNNVTLPGTTSATYTFRVSCSDGVGSAQIDASTTVQGTARAVTIVTQPPATAAPNQSFDVRWTPNSAFTGTVICTPSLTQGSGAIFSPAAPQGQPNVQQVTQVTLPSTSSAVYTIRISCSDGTGSAIATTTNTTVSASTCPSTTSLNGRPIQINSASTWQQSRGEPFPGVASLGTSITYTIPYPGFYDSLEFDVPSLSATFPEGRIYTLGHFRFLSTGVVAQTVSECQGDFRANLLVTPSATFLFNKKCADAGVKSGIRLSIRASGEVPAGSGNECPVVPGRKYYWNFTYGVSNPDATVDSWSTFLQTPSCGSSSCGGFHTVLLSQ